MVAIIGSIVSAAAGQALKTIFNGGDGKQQPGGVQIVKQFKKETTAEMVERLRKSVEALGGKKGQKYWDEKRRRQSMIGQRKPLKSAKSKAAQYWDVLEEARRTAAGTQINVARSSAIKKLGKPTQVV
jgi:hypothetical protein